VYAVITLVAAEINGETRFGVPEFWKTHGPEDANGVVLPFTNIVVGNMTRRQWDIVFTAAAHVVLQHEQQASVLCFHAPLLCFLLVCYFINNP
jgi:hypothetical protein